MSKLFDDIRARVSANRMAKRVDIPEWGEDGKPFELFLYPLTLHDIVAAQKRAASEAEQNCFLIQLKAMDKNGEKLFDVADIGALMDQDADVIGRIVRAMNLSSGYEEQLKN